MSLGWGANRVSSRSVVRPLPVVTALVLELKDDDDCKIPSKELLAILRQSSNGCDSRRPCGRV